MPLTYKKFSTLMLIPLLAMFISACSNNNQANTDTAQQETTVTLPAPEPEGELGIDANVNDKNIDQYLNLDNTVYRDVRLLNDPADWEAIDGDSKLSGYVDGFEIVPYPYLAPTHDLPDVVGKSYTGPTLFIPNKDGSYEPVYYESMDILEDLFPPDKNIVLMCGGGGYAGMTRDLLVSLGWDENKIWNAGGWWYYNGTHAVNVKRDNGHQQYTWDFQNVPYHYIDFDVLHHIGSEPDPQVEPAKELVDGLTRLNSQSELQQAIADNETLVTYVYLPGCTSCAKFAPIVAELAESNQVTTYAIAYNDLTDASMRTKVNRAPGILVFKDNKIVANLSPTEDADTEHYKSLKNLTKWLKQYIDIDVIEGQATAEITCEDGCEP